MDFEAQAKLLGKQAYKRGLELKPVADVELIKLFGGSDARQIKEVVEAWVRGWEQAWIKDAQRGLSS